METELSPYKRRYLKDQRRRPAMSLKLPIELRRRLEARARTEDISMNRVLELGLIGYLDSPENMT